MLVFFDSDTQNDFILSTGKFPVPNAENIRINLARLTQYARKRKIKIISSMDRHFGSAKFHDLEMTELSTWGGPFPMHCMDGTPGQKKVKETSPRKAAIIENKPYSAAKLNSFSKKPEIVIEKQRFSAFSNPNTSKLLKLLKVKKVVLYGISTDYAVRSAALEMRKMGIDVYLVIDASKSFNVKPADSEISIRQMQASGVHIKSTDDLIRNLPLA
ncbi:MAG: cysteine hydrolase family protein [Candidatus Micrarchaeota archaeon]